MLHRNAVGLKGHSTTVTHIKNEQARRAEEIIASDEKGSPLGSLVTLDIFELAHQQCHPIYDMPRLYVHAGEQPRRVTARPSVSLIQYVGCHR